jgi:hypothetical protein
MKEAHKNPIISLNRAGTGFQEYQLTPLIDLRHQFFEPECKEASAQL